MPLISIIIPAYNSADTIIEALESVAAQTVGDYETIVVDDASTDDTVAVVERWVEREKAAPLRLRMVRLESNSGPAAARNRGIEAAQGPWIAFLDADDAWMPWRLELQLCIMAEHRTAAMVCGGTVSFEGATDPAAPVDARCRPLTLGEFATGNPVATSTVLARREALVAVGGFDGQFMGPEDYDLWMRVAGRYPVLLADAPLARYRHRPGSLSLDDRRFLPQVLRVLDKAFAEGGALHGCPQLRRRALANQYWNASWMAFSRGTRPAALAFLAKAFVRDPRVGGRRKLPVLWRYLFGKPE